MGLKHSKAPNECLTEAEINALISSTKMSKSEILKWHKGFMLDCPSGRLTKNQFIKIYEELFPSGRAKKFCELVFNVFDKNKSNTIGTSYLSNV
jgi:neuronal calcium sensor 1